MTRAVDWWYAVQCRSGEELQIVDALIDLVSVNAAYCPVYKIRKKVSRHSRKFEEITKPLFGKYLFMQFNTIYRPWGEVTGIKHVDGFVSIGGEPLPIRHKSIMKLRSECEAGTFNDKGIGGVINVGDKVQISLTGGADGKEWTPFGGMTGEFRALSEGGKALIELSLFGRSTKVEIPTGLIERLL